MLIFDDEIDWGVRKPAESTAPAVSVDLDTLVVVARTQRPRDVVQVVYWPPDEPHVVQIVMGKATNPDAATASVKFDARTGAVLREEPDLETGFMALMLRLHAGLPGTVFLGGMGLLFVAALVSGAVVYGPFMRKLPFGTVCRERAARLRWLDLHNLFGIVTLVWALVVGMTGVALAVLGRVSRTGRRLCVRAVPRIQVTRDVRSAYFRHTRQDFGRITGCCPPGDVCG